MVGCQEDLHKWGHSNQVTFDAGKESFHILSKVSTFGEEFTILGIDFDLKLNMYRVVDDCVCQAGWKLRTLLRSRRFFSLPELLQHYKSQVLSFIEYRTPALTHASTTVLAPLDAAQNIFLHELGISLEKGLLDFNLAPLCVRRDIANLGIIHRSLPGKGPEHFHSFFVLDNSSQYYGTRSRSPHARYLRDPYRGMGRDYLNRGLLGYIAVYNLLPDFAIEARDVKTFQSRLSRMLKDYVREGNEDWSYLYSARIPLFNFHPLRHI